MNLGDMLEYLPHEVEPRHPGQSIQRKLIAFHRAMNVPILPSPRVPADDRVRLRAKLNLEEAVKEFFEACFDFDSDLTAVTRKKVFQRAIEDLEWIAERTPLQVNLASAADALADAAYVIEGANLEFGIDSGPVLDEVHAANMRKTTGPIREDGKRLKPPGWVGPDIVGVLERQRA